MEGISHKLASGAIISEMTRKSWQGAPLRLLSMQDTSILIPLASTKTIRFLVLSCKITSSWEHSPVLTFSSLARFLQVSWSIRRRKPLSRAQWRLSTSVIWIVWWFFGQEISRQRSRMLSTPPIDMRSGRPLKKLSQRDWSWVLEYPISTGAISKSFWHIQTSSPSWTRLKRILWIMTKKRSNFVTSKISESKHMLLSHKEMINSWKMSRSRQSLKETTWMSTSSFSFGA